MKTKCISLWNYTCTQYIHNRPVAINKSVENILKFMCMRNSKTCKANSELLLLKIMDAGK